MTRPPRAVLPVRLARLAVALPAALALAGAATPARAAERTVAVGSFERVRVAGPFEVRIHAGGSPGVRIVGDEAALDGVEVAAEGGTLVVRAAHRGLGGAPVPVPASDGAPVPAPDGAPLVVTLSTPALGAITVAAGAHVLADRVAGARVDLAVNGSGALGVSAVDAGQLYVTVIGAGSMTLGGKALSARLLTNGPGQIDAAALDASDLVVRLDGTGETRARARYTARVTNLGAGRVTVAGDATCVVTAASGGPVACGRVR